MFSKSILIISILVYSSFVFQGHSCSVPQEPSSYERTDDPNIIKMNLISTSQTHTIYYEMNTNELLSNATVTITPSVLNNNFNFTFNNQSKLITIQNSSVQKFDDIQFTLPNETFTVFDGFISAHYEKLYLLTASLNKTNTDYI